MKKHKFVLLIYLLIISLTYSVNASEFYSRQTLWSLEFEDSMGGAENYTYAEFMLELKNGTLAARYVESKPYMGLNAFERPIAADEIECIDVKISSQNDMRLKFYFATDKASNWSEDRAFYIQPTGGSEMNVYSIDTSGIKNWGNNITSLRMDFLGADGDYATNELNIDYIRILGREGKSTQIVEDGILYDFEKNSKTDGWKFNTEDSEASIENGSISFESDDAKTLETCGMNAVSSKEIGSISIALQNETGADKARLYFTNIAGGEYIDYFEFDVVPNDNKIRTYKIVTGKSESWTGDISGLKFDFGTEPGRITVDEIYLRKYPYKTTLDDSSIKVSGKAEPSSAVSLQIAKKGEDLENYADAVIYTDETKAAADGSFSFTCAAPRTDGPIKLDITAAVNDTLYKSCAAYVPSGYAETIRLKYNSAISDENALLADEIITDGYEYLGIDAAGYEEYASVCKNAEKFGGQLVHLGPAENMDALRSKISDAAVFVMFTESEKNTAVLIAEKYDGIIQLSQNRAYGIYSSFETSEKSEILDAVRTDASDLEDIKNVFAEKTILCGISFTIGTDSVKTIIHNNKDIIGVDLSGEASLKNPERLYAKLAGNLYDSYERLAEAYNLALQTCKAEEKNTSESSYSSSSGGGGTGSSSGRATAPITPAALMVKSEPFKDLESFEWAKESIDKLYEKGIVSGKSEGSYMPADNVSRAEFVKMLTIAMDISKSTDVPFTDIEDDAWYGEYIRKAFASGIIFGNSEGMFCPDENISRQDMAVIIYRAAKDYFAVPAEAEFVDTADIADYAAEAVNALNANGIVNGMPDGRFMPAGFATRAQTAVIIERLMKHMGKI